MENVVAFNNELSSLYEGKPPISKAKMASITKAAMRGIKFYKHVVQSVEKFILKCKPEYKVPGLYVIDSIVRQSRHQFGPEKDVFAPRFARNIKETFANLFRCAPEDKSRIIRVLNLWQKNNVFAPEVIQPIFDLADPNHPIYQLPPGGSAASGPSSSGVMGDMSGASANGLNASVTGLDMNMSNMSGAGVAHGVADEKLGNLTDLSNLSHEKAQNVLDNSTLRQLEHMQHYLKRQTGTSSGNATTASKAMRESHSCDNIHLPSSTKRIHHPETYSKYTKGAHEPMYYDRNSNTEDNDDIAEIDASSPKLASKKLLDNNNLKQLLNDPNVLRQLQTLQNFQKIKQQEEKHKFNEMRLQEEAFEKHYQNALKTVGPVGGQDGTDFGKEVEFISEEQKIEVINLDGNDSRSPTPDRDRYNKRRRGSRSRSRSRDRRDRDRGRGRRSRSRSRSRSPHSNRRRSSRDRGNERSMRDKERERERRKKGLPDIRKEHLSVCSTTLWVGHISKLVYQEELSDTFGEFGDIVSIDQIVPRGCAFIVMNRRQDAYKAMQALKNYKLQGKAITISWAAGKGVKSKEWKDFWDLDLGVTFIPWNKLDENTDFDSLEEGGMFDEDSMPGWMKDKIHHIKSQKEKANDMSSIQPPSVPPPNNSTTSMLFGIDTTQPPPGPPPSIMPMVPGQFSMAPPMGGPPRMLGPPMGMPLPGPGMPMPPNMVPGMPPPHPMMAPMGIMPPGFPPIPGPVGGPPHMGLPPNSTQFPPPPVTSAITGNNVPTNTPTPTSNSNNVASSDDQMDIEMEDADEQMMQNTNASNTGATSQLNFNQPPPMFGNNISAPGTENANNNTSDQPFTRDRNRGPSGNSRWSSGENEVSGENSNGPPGSRWREANNGPPVAGPNGMPNFNDGRNVRGPVLMNMPPIDMNNPPQRPEFMGDFDNRGPRSGRGGNDFFPNMQNRFNQPTSLLQMRIPPPNSFNPRMGGPPMFMRGGPGGPGNRPQGPGGYFNPRNPFDRDVGPMTNMRGGRGGGRGRGGRGGQMAPHNSGNWSDEDMDDNFQRRSGPSGNRYRDRSMDGGEDRFNRGGSDRNNAGRRGGRAASRDRGSDYERGRDRDRNQRDRSSESRRRLSREDRSNKSNTDKESQLADTEEDWDAELKEYDARNENASAKRSASTRTEKSENDDNLNKTDPEESVTKDEVPSHNERKYSERSETQPVDAADNLYDELPAPVMKNADESNLKEQTPVPAPTSAPEPEPEPAENSAPATIEPRTEESSVSKNDGSDGPAENAEQKKE